MWSCHHYHCAEEKKDVLYLIIIKPFVVGWLVAALCGTNKLCVRKCYFLSPVVLSWHYIRKYSHRMEEYDRDDDARRRARWALSHDAITHTWCVRNKNHENRLSATNAATADRLWKMFQILCFLRFFGIYTRVSVISVCMSLCIKRLPHMAMAKTRRRRLQPTQNIFSWRCSSVDIKMKLSRDSWWFWGRQDLDNIRVIT